MWLVKTESFLARFFRRNKRPNARRTNTYSRRREDFDHEQHARK